MNHFGLAERIAGVPGVIGVVLGGSRARGTHIPDSDHDLGIYYRPPLDTAGLAAIVREVAGPSASVTEPGGWGPWVDGGGWLTVEGEAVDLIYRDLDRVRAVHDAAVDGRYRFHQQAGHPLGFADFGYAGELALARILADPDGVLTGLQERVAAFPPKLSQALIDGLWEADFLIGVARKSVSRSDPAYVAGCLFRVVGVCAHALHGAAGRWLINEKGAVAASAALPGAPDGFRERADGLFTRLDRDPLRLGEVLDAAADLVLDTVDACTRMAR